MSKTSGSEPLLFAEDFNDPPLGEVLEWHMSICEFCKERELWPPPPFGAPISTRHCQDYQDIINEYSEYEGHYAMKGNP